MDAGSIITIAYMDGGKAIHEQDDPVPLRKLLTIDGLGLAVVIDACFSRKVGRDTNKRITSRRDPRPSFWG